MSDPLRSPDASHWPEWANSTVEEESHTYWDDGLYEKHVDGVLTDVAVNRDREVDDG